MYSHSHGRTWIMKTSNLLLVQKKEIWTSQSCSWQEKSNKTAAVYYLSPLPWLRSEIDSVTGDFFDWSRATWSSCDLHAQGHRLSMRVASGVKSDSCVLWDSVGDLLNTYPLCMQFEKWGHWLNFVSKQWKHWRLLFWLCKNFWNVKTTIKVILILLLL